MNKGKEALEKSLKKDKVVAMLAPSFVAEFDYPYIIRELRRLGFNKVVELTFGAKLVNHEYHKILKNADRMWIASVCPGIVETIKSKYPQYRKNLMPIVSPMIATAMVCKKVYRKHKTCFISPCNFKKIEAQINSQVDFAIDYQELWKMIDCCCIKSHKKGKETFDLFSNEYTRIYPLAGGLSKSAHLKGVLKPGEERKFDGISEVEKFLESGKKVRFLDCTFCIGGCISGPKFSSKLQLEEKKKRVLKYLERAKNESIGKGKRGILEKAKGIDFSAEY